LTDELAAHLARSGLNAGSADALLFTGVRGGILRRSWAHRHFNPAVARAGLPEGVTFHGLRHVATSYMVAGNEHPRTIQHRLGHADPRLSMRLYAHVPDDVDRAAADHLEELRRKSLPSPGETGSGL
jgi:integrase